MTVLRRVIHIAAIVLNALWAVRVVWSVWGLVNWHAVLHSNPFDNGGWIVGGAFFAPVLGIVTLVWSFKWNDESAKVRF
jgi:hypothetical protein